MKIGDEVRFLSDVGGGTVVAFKDKNIVLVKDADGFEIPTLVSDVVVVKSDSYERTFKGGKPVAMVKTEEEPKKKSHKLPKQEEDDIPDIPVYHPAPQERREGEKLNVYLAFVPTNAEDMVNTTFDTYIINDSNYFITLSYLSAEGTAWRARFEGTLEPNTKFFVEEVAREKLDDISRVALQMISYKREKPFVIKPAVSVELRIDGSKFYKVGAFKANEFFAEPSLVYDLVRDDVASRGVFVDAGEVRDALLKKNTSVQPSGKQMKIKGNDTLEIDLHAHALFDSTDGLSNSDILNTQLAKVREVMNKCKHSKGKRIVFIHGKGDGVLRAEVLKVIKHDYSSCRTQDASFQEYGFGATLVVVG